MSESRLQSASFVAIKKLQTCLLFVVNLCRTNVSGVNKWLAARNCGINYIYSRAAFYLFEEQLKMYSLIMTNDSQCVWTSFDCSRWGAGGHTPTLNRGTWNFFLLIRLKSVENIWYGSKTLKFSRVTRAFHANKAIFDRLKAIRKDRLAYSYISPF